MCKSGEAFAAPCDVVLSDEDIVEPDLLFISAARAAIITEKNIQGPPDLVVEILSASTRKIDEVVKRKLYERYGVRGYWIVAPELEGIKIYRLTDQGYIRAQSWREKQPTPCPPRSCLAFRRRSPRSSSSSR